MDDRIDLLLEEKPRFGGVSAAVLVSLIVHSLLVVYVVRAYHPVAARQVAPPMVRYVELMRQDPRQFVEAPGKKVTSAPASAPFSNANRKASMPEPTGSVPTQRPGEGGAIWSPPAQAASRARQAAAEQAAQAAQQKADPQQSADAQPGSSSSLAFRKPVQQSSAVDWHSAIKQVGATGSSGARGMDVGGAGGGEKGYAESGPLSFETQWYDWGDYAESMVSRIRVNWYGHMPEQIRYGLKGVVTIRFTIHRDGSLSDVTILQSSGIPPYDAAAKQAIELSSPLRPLPADFPNPTERVTCMFYYNMEIPARH